MKRWPGNPGGLFWKVFGACWITSMLTGLGINLVARLFPRLIELPPVPPSIEQSVGMPVLVGGLIAAVLSALLAWSLSRPLRVLRQAFSEAAAGQLERRVAPLLAGQHDEFADLGRHYDGMAQQLQALLGAQQRLLHDVSHELRSPLARLQMAVGLLQQSPADAAATLQRIEREVQRLDALVGEVLTLARLESGAALGAPRPVDVMALLASVAEDAAFEAHAQQRALRWRCEPQALELPAHGELLRRAFDNAVRNALKYTPAGSCVEVDASCGEGELRITVADRGPGLPDKLMGHIFEPFVRVDGPARVSGFGLGLAIARRATEAHGGTVRARARDGGGLLLRFALPLNPT